jgi:hypothetical protein
MPSRIISYDLPDQNKNAVLLVEVDDPTVDGNQVIGIGAIERAEKTLSSALDDILPGINYIADKLRSSVQGVEQTNVEFGLKFTVGADALIAKTAIEGNIKVTLSWKTPQNRS